MSTAKSIKCTCLTLMLWIAGAIAPSIAQDRPDAPAGGGSAQDAETVLDLIPDDAALAIAIPNLQRLKERGDLLFAETNAQGLRVSEMFTTLYGYLNVHGIVDEQRPAAAMIANLHDLGFEDAEPNNLFQAIVFRLPVGDLAETAKRFDLDEDAMATGRIVSRDVANGWPPGQVCIQDGYLLLATSKKAIESVLDGEPIAAEFSGERRAAAARSDIVVLAGTHPWANSWKEFVERIESEEFTAGQVPNEEQLKELLRKTVPDTRFALLTATIDDGIHLRLTGRFDRGGSAEQVLTRMLGRKSVAADLAPLPQGLVLGAIAAQGEELRTIATARLLAPLALQPINQSELLRDNDPTRMLGTFDGVLRQLTGARLALYATGAATPTELSNRGMMAGVFLLDTVNPRQLIESIAAEGVVLGGQSRATDETDAPPRISLRHLPDRETLAGHSVDYLEIETDSIDPETATGLREAFGPSWMFIRAVSLEKQIVMLLGTERRLLEATLQGIDGQGAGLAVTTPLVESRKRLDAAHQAAFYVSLQRTLPAARGDGIASMHRSVDRVTSAAVTIERDLLQIEFWLPLAEIKAIPQQWWRFW